MSKEFNLRIPCAVFPEQDFLGLTVSAAGHAIIEVSNKADEDPIVVSVALCLDRIAQLRFGLLEVAKIIGSTPAEAAEAKPLTDGFVVPAPAPATPLQKSDADRVEELAIKKYATWAKLHGVINYPGSWGTCQRWAKNLYRTDARVELGLLHAKAAVGVPGEKVEAWPTPLPQPTEEQVKQRAMELLWKDIHKDSRHSYLSQARHELTAPHKTPTTTGEVDRALRGLPAWKVAELVLSWLNAAKEQKQ